MKSLKLRFVVLILMSLGLPASAGVNISAFGTATSGSSHGSVTAGYDGELELQGNGPVQYYFSLQSGRGQTKTSFVEGLPESQTKTTNYGINSGLTFFEKVSISYDYSSESVNENAVYSKEYTISPAVRLANFSFAFSYSQKKVFQNKPYLILTKDFSTDLEFIQASNRGSVGYKFTDDFSLSFSHTRFTYDKNMETAYVLLSGINLATTNGTDMLSQIYSLLDSSTELSGVYSLHEMADLEFSLGQTIDFYSPKAASSDFRLGVLIFQNSSFSWGMGLTSTRSDSTITPSRSYDANLSYAF
jgi:hypothetical protein